MHIAAKWEVISGLLLKRVEEKREVTSLYSVFYSKDETNSVFFFCFLQLFQITVDYFPAIWKSLKNIFISRCVQVKTLHIEETEVIKSIKRTLNARFVLSAALLKIIGTPF